MTPEAEITTSASAPEAAVRQRKHRARHTASVLLIVLVSILTPLVVTAGWAVTTVTDTNRFVSTMSAISSNPTVTNYMAAQAASTIVTELHVERHIAQLLEEKLHSSVAPVLAPLITTSIQAQVTKILSAVLASQQFQHLFTANLRLLHSAFVTAMTTNESQVSQGAKLALDVSPQILAAINTLDKKGIKYLDFAKPFLKGDKHLLVTLAQGRQFKEVQGYFHLATMLRWVLWIATLVLAAAAVVIDPRRRRSGFWLGIGVACSAVVMLALLSIGKQYAMTHSPTPSDVADVIFSTLTSWLRWELRAIVLIGLIAAAILWVTGPSRHARGLRGLFRKEEGKAAHAVEGVIGARATERVEGEGATVIDWFGRYATALAWLGVIAGGIILATVADSLVSATVTILLVIAWFASMVAIRRRVATEAQGDATAPSRT